MAKRRLLEGFAQGAARNVRQFFARDPAAQAMQLRRGGSPSAERAGMPFSLVNQFGYDGVAEHLRVDQDLTARYTDAEEMDEYPEISVAFDIYADDAATPNEDDLSIWFSSENKAVERDLHDTFHKRVRVEQDIWGLERTLAKYGNAFSELIVTEQGLVGMNFLPPPTIRRVEGPHGQLLGFVQDIRGEFNIGLSDFYRLAKERGADGSQRRPPGELTIFEDWEMVHWRLRGKHMRSMYGHSVADPARWIWKRLSLLEDALLIYKLDRAPSRYAFYVDVGEYDAERGLAYVNRVKNQFVKKKFVNPSTGKLDMRYNPLAHDEDFFIPMRGGKETTRIETLQGPDYAETDTVEYHRDKLVAAVKVPKSYMGYGGEEVKQALSAADIRFARTVMRLQRESRVGFRQAARVHFIAKGASIDRDEYSVRMNTPSAILELAKVEVMAATSDLAQRMGEIVSTRWVLTNLFDFSDQEAEEVMLERDEEQKRKGKVEAEVQRYMQGAEVPEEPKAPAPKPIEVGGEEGEEEKGEKKQDRGASEMRVARQTAYLLEQRMDRFFRRLDEGNRRSFEQKMKPGADDRIVTALRKDPDMARRMRSIEGLLGDIRSSLR